MADIRLDKLLSAAAGLTRSESKLMIRQGRVTVEGIKAQSCDMKVDSEADIRLDGTLIIYREFCYLMMNKPAGVLSATEDAAYKTVIDLLPPEYKRYGLFCAGRLDRDSEGLLLLTNDGNYCHNIISPKKDIKKEYYIEISRPLEAGAEEIFASGMKLGDGTVCLPAKLDIHGDGISATVIISEGKYHQVKRMISAVGSEVTYLKRLAIGGLRLDNNLSLGGFRELSVSEASAVFMDH